MHSVNDCVSTKNTLDSEHALAHIIERAAHLLPSQGPIEVFVHHNTLHAFEEHHFHEAVKLAQQRLQGEPYLAEQKYHQLLETGRITNADVTAALKADLRGTEGHQVCRLGTRWEIRSALLSAPLHTGTDAEIQWLIAETDALDRFFTTTPSYMQERMLERMQDSLRTATADTIPPPIVNQFGTNYQTWRPETWRSFCLNMLWHASRRGALETETVESVHPLRTRDILLETTGCDTDTLIDETIIPLCAAFFDRGYSSWRLPTNKGLFQSFVTLYSLPNGFNESWLSGLNEELGSMQSTSPLTVILHTLTSLGVPSDAYEEYIIQTLLALPGWAGMIAQLSAPSATDQTSPADALFDYVAIRLILEKYAIRHIGRDVFSCYGSPVEVRAQAETHHVAPETHMISKAFLIFQLAQRLGWNPFELMEMSLEEWHTLCSELDHFASIDRRRVLHEAYERHYREHALNGFAIHSSRRKHLRPSPPVEKPIESTNTNTCAQTDHRPGFQLVCCIDDREESFRRHIEEIAPTSETFGAAGFFAVAMYYRGAADANYQALCPAIMTPDHYVQEDVGYTFEGIHRVQTVARRRLGQLTHSFHTGSRTFLGGIVTGLVGSLASFPLVARVIAPRLTSQIHKRFGVLLHRPPITRLQLERYQPEPGPHNGHIGYTLQEMAAIVKRLLEDIGLIHTEKFSRLVIICGHGSSSLNNPHESAYCCGACAGKRGGPNARAFAQMANNWRVRALLSAEGLNLPDDTFFIGSYHNTCDDSVVYYDLDYLPPSHRSDFEKARIAIEKARFRNAHERCRRFSSASIHCTEEEALSHVEGRSEDLSQVRPEYNHATNAMCLVGRREWSRGLFLDRRAFLTSYDPETDDAEYNILTRILAAAIPVCAGISLEYYFSTVDNVIYGSGSKLPHNVSAMLGVMEGALSDLRTGLYQQMVEIHEPMRLLFVIESTPKALLTIMQRHEGIRKLCEGEWVQLAVLNAETSEIQFFRDGVFDTHVVTNSELPEVDNSRQWYERQRQHLPFCSIREPASKASSSYASN